MRYRRERVSGWRRIVSRIGCALALVALLLSTGCAPTTDEDVRLAGVGTARAAPEPRPMPRFTETGFVTADGRVLPLRKWLPEGEARGVILALHGFNDYSKSFEEPATDWASRCTRRLGFHVATRQTRTRPTKPWRPGWSSPSNPAPTSPGGEEFGSRTTYWSRAPEWKF